MVLEDRLSSLPSRRENLLIELHHNIQHVNFTPNSINITRGATEGDPILHPVYHITLSNCPNHMHKVPAIAHHFWGAGMN